MSHHHKDPLGQVHELKEKELKEKEPKEKEHGHQCCRGKDKSCHEQIQPVDETPIQEAPPLKLITISTLEVDQMKQDAADWKDKYLRLLAESENTRKRLQKDKQEMIQYAIQNIIVDFLNPIDHMENALKFTQQMSQDVQNWATGFQMIMSQFKEVLNANGVVPFESQGHTFDPHKHEAIETLESDKYAPGIVIEESLRGYNMNDKIIRPARVKVSKAMNKENNNPTQEI